MKTKLLVALFMMVSVAGFAATQTTCPVMQGRAVNPKLYVDADGYRIYVCCGYCVKAVKADPAKYIQEMKAAGIELEPVAKK